MTNNKPKLKNTKIDPKKILIYFLILTSHFSLFLAPASAADGTTMTADRMEYLSASNSYIAKGSVTITFEGATLTADEMFLDNNTSDSVAVGNVLYKDDEADIAADRIEINLKTKIGTIYENYTYYKKHNFHIRSQEIKKIGDKTFVLDEATVTTCDAEPPAWHISSRDVSVTQHEKITGWHGSFNIRDVPVLYTPYFWAPLNRDRQSGLLFPSFGYSSKRGYYYNQGIYWAIEDNQDATLYLDYYSEKGVGEGLDYRYIAGPGSDGELWLYHVRDTEPARSLTEIKSYHNQELPYNISGYLKLHAVNYRDYYEIMDSTSLNRFGLSSWEPNRFGLASEERLQQYLESNLHVSQQYDRGRMYFLTQGRQGLQESSSEIPQSLPEIGFVLNTDSIKFFSFNMDVKGVNFWKGEGQDGLRLDLHPVLSFSYGRLLNITQSIGLRETAYFLNDPEEYADRFSYDLSTAVTTRFFKKYTSFVNIIEPRLEYEYTPEADRINVPVFDSVDSIVKINKINYSFSNIFEGRNSTDLHAKIILSQSYSLLDTDEPFSPLLAETTLSSRYMDLSINASYDIDDKTLDDFIGSMNLHNKTGFVGAGKSLRRSTEVDQYTFAAGLNSPIEIFDVSLPISLHGQIWYDVNSKDIQQMNVTSVYSRQCWGLMASFTKNTDAYQVLIGFQFKGLGTARFGFPDMPILFSDPQGGGLSVDPYRGYE